MRAWRMRERCRSTEAPLPWLLAITRNEALRLREARGRRAEVELTHDEPAGEAGEPPDDAVVRRLAVQEALRELPDEDRVMLELRYRRDLTQAAVAKRLDMPEGTVKVRLHRLRHQLRSILEEQREAG